MYYNIEKKMKKIRLKGEEPYLFFFYKKGQIFLGVEALKRDENEV